MKTNECQPNPTQPNPTQPNPTQPKTQPNPIQPNQPKIKFFMKNNIKPLHVVYMSPHSDPSPL